MAGNYLDKVRRIQEQNPSPDGDSGVATGEVEPSELSEMSPNGDNHAPSRVCCCSDDDYIIGLHLLCPTCDGAVCSRCGECFSASMTWRKVERARRGEYGDKA